MNSSVPRDVLKRIALPLSIGAGMVLACTAATLGDDFPTQPIRFIMPFPAGQGPDLLGRLPAEAASANLPKPIVIEYRPGGQGAVGMLELINSKPDGYSIGFCGSTCYTVPQLMSPAPFDTNGFKQITTLARTPLVLLARADLDARDLKSVMDRLRTTPGSMSIGAPSAGSSLSLTNYILQEAAGVKFHIVPYSAPSDSITDIMGGRLDMVFVTLGQGVEFVKGGKLRALAVTGAERSGLLPDVATFAEQGVAGMEAEPSVHAVAPANTPDAVMETLNAAFVKALHDPALVARMNALGIMPVGDSAQEAQVVAAGEIARYGKVIRDNDIRLGSK